MQGQNAPRREFSEIEYNAQRMNDVEIPLFKLEQRVEKLELQHQNIPLTFAEPIAEEVANKFNKGLQGYLPSIATMLTSFQTFKDSTHTKLGDLQMALQESGGGVDMDLFKQLQFKVSNFTNEIGFMKKTFSVQKLQQLESMENQLKTLQDENQLMSLELENKAARQEVEALEEKLKGFAPRHLLSELREDLQRTVKEEDIRILQAEVENVKTGFDQVILKKELRDRLEAFSQDVNQRVSDRPTMNYLKRILQQQDEKVEKINAGLSESIDFQLQEIQENGKELAAFGQKMDKLEAELAIKLTKEEGTKLWAQFGRFAEYNDLKALYAKVLPPIAQFEEKLMNYCHENATTERIVQGFDQVLAEKASKHQLSVLYEHVAKECAPKGGQDSFIKRAEEKLEEMQAEIKQQNEMVELMNENQVKVLTAEVKKQTAHLKKSAFEDVSDGMGAAGGGVSEAMKTMINNKVDKIDLDEIKNTKSSKTDTEMGMRQIEILHKQLLQLSLLIAQEFRSSIEQDGQESIHARTNKKVAFLHQALLISQWISSFEPSSVNDCFDKQRLQVPAQLAQYEAAVNEDIKKIEGMKLSPNRIHTNDQLRAASNSIIGRLGITGLFKQARLSKNSGVSPNFAGDAKVDVGLDPPPFVDDVQQFSSKQILKLKRPRHLAGTEGLIAKSHERSASSVMPALPQKGRLVVGNAYKGSVSPMQRSKGDFGKSVHDARLKEDAATHSPESRTQRYNRSNMTKQKLQTLLHTQENFHVNSGVMSSKYKMTDVSQEHLESLPLGHPLKQDSRPMNGHNTTGPAGFAAAGNTPLEKLKNSELTGTYLPGIYNQ